MTHLPDATFGQLVGHLNAQQTTLPYPCVLVLFWVGATFCDTVAFTLTLFASLPTTTYHMTPPTTHHHYQAPTFCRLLPVYLPYYYALYPYLPFYIWDGCWFFYGSATRCPRKRCDCTFNLHGFGFIPDLCTDGWRLHPGFTPHTSFPPVFQHTVSPTHG